MPRKFALQANFAFLVPPSQDMISPPLPDDGNRARFMFLIMFGISLAIIIASAIRRPVLLWQKGVLLLAVIMLLAVCVAWGIEYFLQSA
jgi:hypothetical protein